MRPHRRQSTRLPRPWDSPGKNTGVGCHFLLQCMKVKSESEVTQSCPTLSGPVDCSPPGSSVHGIFQARVLEWGAIAFASTSCQMRIIIVPSLAGLGGLNDLCTVTTGRQQMLHNFGSCQHNHWAVSRYYDAAPSWDICASLKASTTRALPKMSLKLNFLYQFWKDKQQREKSFAMGP